MFKFEFNRFYLVHYFLKSQERTIIYKSNNQGHKEKISYIALDRFVKYFMVGGNKLTLFNAHVYFARLARFVYIFGGGLDDVIIYARFLALSALCRSNSSRRDRGRTEPCLFSD